MIILPPNIRYFSSFLAVSTKDYPVNRNIHAHPPTIGERSCVKGIYRAIRAIKCKKICGWKIHSRTNTFGAELHKSNIRIKK